MKRLRLHTLLPALLAGTIVLSCTGGGAEPGGGIGGSGITAQGTITGFGSIFVNGVEYQTDMAMVEVDEKDALETDLALGMIVTLTGSLDGGGASGTAQSVVVDHKIRGPVRALNPSNDDTRRIDVFGVSVRISRTDTVFDGTTFDDVAIGDMLRVSGFDAGAGVLEATRVQRIGLAGGGEEVELSGAIAGYDVMAGTFDLGPVRVSIDAATELPDDPLADGLLVEVEGILQADLLTIAAREIEVEDDGLPDDVDDIEIEGIVSEFTTIDDFMVGAVRVDAGNAEFDPPSLVGNLAVGERVEVEGEIRAGVLIAEEVKGRGGAIHVDAYVQSIDAGAGTLSLKLTPTGTATVLTGGATVFKDGRDQVPSFVLGDIDAGDYLRIKADEIGGGAVRANEIKRERGGDKVVVKAFAEAAAHTPPVGSITLLGVGFTTDDADTDFEVDDDDDDDDIDANDFFARIVPGTSRVELRDQIVTGTMAGDGTAEEVELDD